MCLLSSGLSNGILSIAQSSGTGAKLFLDKIPIARETFDFAETEKDLSPLVAALNGGEDYEMLFTLPLNSYEELSKEYNIES
jgi:thiamine-monophosphate kinase